MHPMYNNDVMIDLETTGVSAGCCVLSIGACTLDGNSQFYIKISHEDSRANGLVDFTPTMDWWLKQSSAARLEAFSGESSVRESLTKLNAWLSSIKPSSIWGNGAAFDIPILAEVYNAVNMTPAWPRFSDHCYRTMKNIFANIPADPFVGVKHNALADAEFQAAHLRKILSHLEGINNAS